jgi:hypothetical protein
MGRWLVLLAAACSSSGNGAECDILFACYNGFCTNFCHIGTTECGYPDDCLDVGCSTHDIGVCRL